MLNVRQVLDSLMKVPKSRALFIFPVKVSNFLHAFWTAMLDCPFVFLGGQLYLKCFLQMVTYTIVVGKII